MVVKLLTRVKIVVIGGVQDRLSKYNKVKPKAKKLILSRIKEWPWVVFYMVKLKVNSLR